jgi:hypothetical protein
MQEKNASTTCLQRTPVTSFTSIDSAADADVCSLTGLVCKQHCMWGPSHLQEVSGLQAPKLHVSVFVVPHQAGVPDLHKAAGRGVGDARKDAQLKTSGQM